MLVLGRLPKPNGQGHRTFCTGEWHAMGTANARGAGAPGRTNGKEGSTWLEQVGQQAEQPTLELLTLGVAVRAHG
jgi:hypothetical protein